MNTESRERARDVFFGICLGLGVLHLVLFLFVALRRVAYPFDLEWMEGGQLIHSFEMLQGRFPFGPPTADHIAFPYQPLYAAIVAGLGAIFGLSLPLARGVSIAATLVCGALVAFVVWRETESRRHATLAGLSVFSVYAATGFWYDLARVDSLFLALLLGGLCAARYIARPLLGAVISAALLVLAYKTKQLALPFFALVLPLLYPRSRGAAFLFAGLAATLLCTDYWLSQRATDGWFGFFMNDVPRGQPYQSGEFMRIWVVLATDVPLFIVLTLVGSEGFFRGKSLLARARETWVLCVALGFVATLAAWARPGGWANNLLTTYVFLMIPAFIGVHRVSQQGTERERALVYPLVAAQLALLLYDPRPQIPTREDYAAGEELIAALRKAPGPVLVPDRPWFAVLAGKAPSYHSNGYWEMGFQKREGLGLPDLEQRLTERYYSMVVVQVPPYRSKDAPSMWPRALIDRYTCRERLPLPGHALAPFTGIIPPPPNLLCVYDPAKTARTAN